MKYTIAMNASTEIELQQADRAVASHNDSFQWRRVWMLAKFYYPILHKQIIMMPIVAAISTFVIAFTLENEQSPMFLTLCSFPTAFMYYFAPIGLARKDSRPISNQLPVTAGEKFVFLMIYFIPVVYLLTSGAMFLSALLFFPLNSKAFEFVSNLFETFDREFGFSPWTAILLTQMIFLQSCVLYGVVTSKKNRMLKGIVNGVAGFLFFLLLCGFGGFLIGLIHSISYEANIDGQAFQREVTIKLITYTGLICGVLSTWLLIKLYKKLKYCGF